MFLFLENAKIKIIYYPQTMYIPTKKLKNGFEMPVYGLGTWQMGGGKEHDISNNDEADVVGIRYALNTGITHIDTAESYASGYTEILVGKAIQGYNRSEIFLVSKVSSIYLYNILRQDEV